jgi:hypothetical protein
MKLAGTDTTTQQRISYASVVVTRYKEGFVDKPRMFLELQNLQTITDPIQLSSYVAELSYDTDYKTDLSKFYTEMYQKAVWDLEEYTSALQTVIVVPERLQAKIAYETAKILKKPKEEKEKWKKVKTYRDYVIYQYDEENRYEARRSGYPTIQGVDLPDLIADIDETYR